MAIFKPSNLSPNFQEVDVSLGEINIEFQVHTSGSYVYAYEVKFYKEFNAEDDKDGEDSIVWQISGNFDKAYTNGDIVQLSLTPPSNKFKNEENYRWNIRLYQDIISDDNPNYENQLQNINNNTTIPTYIGEGMIAGSTRDIIWTKSAHEDIKIDNWVECRFNSINSDFNVFKKDTTTKRKPSYQEWANSAIYALSNLYGANTGSFECFKIPTDSNDGNKTWLDKKYFSDLTDHQHYILISDNTNFTNIVKAVQIQDIIQYNGEFYIVPYNQKFIRNDYRYNAFKEEWPTVPSGQTYYFTIQFRQRQCIYDVIKNIGEHNLNQIITKEPFDFSYKDGFQGYLYCSQGLVEENMSEAEFREKSNRNLKAIYLNANIQSDDRLFPVNSGHMIDRGWILGGNTGENSDYGPLIINPAQCYIKLGNITRKENSQDYSAADHLGEICQFQYVLTEYEPSNWDTAYASYYTRDNSGYHPVQDQSLPNWSLETYYKDDNYDGYYIAMDTSYKSDEYVLLESKPADWDKNYQSYYKKATSSDAGYPYYYPAPTGSSYSADTYYKRNIQTLTKSNWIRIDSAEGIRSMRPEYLIGNDIIKPQAFNLSTYNVENGFTNIKVPEYFSVNTSQYYALYYICDNDDMTEQSVYLLDEGFIGGGGDYHIMNLENGRSYSDFAVSTYFVETNYSVGQQMFPSGQDATRYLPPNEHPTFSSQHQYLPLFSLYTINPTDDIYCLNTAGANSARAWCFSDTNYRVLSVAPSNIVCNNVYLTIPLNAGYLFVNNYLVGGVQLQLISQVKTSTKYTRNNNFDIIGYNYNIASNPPHYYNIFISPNSMIKPDEYRPVYLEFVNDFQTMRGLVINSGTYNRKLSVDTMDDTQYYISFYTLDDSNGVNDNILSPQTRVKIYTQFVDSVPLQYFYARKPLSYNDFTIQRVDNSASALNGTTINYPDIYIYTTQKSNLNTSNQIRYYRYEIYDTNTGDVLFDSGNIYKPSLSCTYMGLLNGQDIKIKLTFEDNLGRVGAQEKNYSISYTETSGSLILKYGEIPFTNTISDVNSDLYAIYKQIGFDNTQWQYLGQFNNINGFDDCNIATGVPVRYKMTHGTIIHTSPYYIPKFSKWILQDLIYDIDNNIYYTEGDIFTFNGNVELSDITYNSNTIKYDSLGQYGRVYKGKLKYQSASLSCLFGEFNVVDSLDACTYYPNTYTYTLTTSEPSDWATNYTSYFTQTAGGTYTSVTGSSAPSWQPSRYYSRYFTRQKLENNQYVDLSPVSTRASFRYIDDGEKMKRLYDCLYNNNLKLLRDPAGNKWIISVTDSINKNIAYKSSWYPTRISFSWQEVMDADQIRIVNINPSSTQSGGNS